MPDHHPESTGSLDRAALRYLARVFETDHPSDEPFVFTRTERRLIRSAEYGSMITSATLGALSVLAFIGPHNLWPKWFTKTHLGYWDWPFISWLFGFLLLYLKVYILTAVHSMAVKFMSLVCQFPRYHDADYSKHLNTVATVALRKGLRAHILKPPPVIPQTVPWHLWGATLKALVTIFVVQLLLRWLPGGTIERGLLWSSGLAFAAWDGWTSYRIVRDARIRILAPMTIRQFVNELVEEYGREHQFRAWIPTVLQEIGIETLSDSYPHLMLRNTLSLRFGLSPTAEAVSTAPLRECPPALQPGLERLLIFAVLIDGRMHPIELLLLHTLCREGWLKTPISDVRRLLKQYRAGQGLWV